MTRNLLALVMGAIGGLAAQSTAFAADIPAPAYKAPAAVVAPPPTWAGIYIGGQAGYAWSRSSYTFDAGVGAAFVENFSYNPNSFIGGGHIGVQGQWGNWVLGVEGTYDWVDLNQTDTAVLLTGRLRRLSIDGLPTVVGKVGYAWDRVLLYAKGGAAFADIETFAINPATGVNASVKQWETGWTVGGGIDYMPIPNWILGVDFNYYNFKYDRGAIASDGTPAAWSNTNTDIFAVKGRVSYLFNWGRW